MKALDSVISALNDAQTISTKVQSSRSDIQNAFANFGRDLQAAIAAAPATQTASAASSLSKSLSDTRASLTDNLLAQSLAALASNLMPAAMHAPSQPTSEAASNTSAIASSSVTGNTTAAATTASSISPTPPDTAAVNNTAPVIAAKESIASATGTSGTTSTAPATTAAIAPAPTDSGPVIPYFKTVAETTEDWSNPLWVKDHPELTHDVTMSYLKSYGSTVTPEAAQAAWEAANDASAPDFKANAGRVFAAQQLAALTPDQRADWNRVQQETWDANHPASV